MLKAAFCDVAFFNTKIFYNYLNTPFQQFEFILINQNSNHATDYVSYKRQNCFF